MKPSFYFNKKLEKIAEELIFDNGDTFNFLEQHGLTVSDNESGVTEELWNLVMDALIRGYYMGKEADKLNNRLSDIKADKGKMEDRQ